MRKLSDATMLILALVFLFGTNADAFQEQDQATIKKLSGIRALNTQIDLESFKNKPFLALLVIGNDASDTKWLAFDGEFAYCDLNSDNSFDEETERFVSKSPDSMKRFKISGIDEIQFSLHVFPVESLPESGKAEGEKGNWLCAQLTCTRGRDTVCSGNVVLTKEIEDASVVWIGGPLRFAPWVSKKPVSTQGSRISFRIATDVLLPAGYKKIEYSSYWIPNLPDFDRTANPLFTLTQNGHVSNLKLQPDPNPFEYSGYLNDSKIVLGKADASISFPPTNRSFIGRWSGQVEVSNLPDRDYEMAREILRTKINRAKRAIEEAESELRKIEGKKVDGEK